MVIKHIHELVIEAGPEVRHAEVLINEICRYISVFFESNVPEYYCIDKEYRYRFITSHYLLIDVLKLIKVFTDNYRSNTKESTEMLLWADNFLIDCEAITDMMEIISDHIYLQAPGKCLTSMSYPTTIKGVYITLYYQIRELFKSLRLNFESKKIEVEVQK